MSIQRLEELEHAIQALLPLEKLRGKADPGLRAALARYAEAVWSVAQDRPSPENSDALIRSARSLASHPIFILGVHRSGTTLMHHLLDGHPSLTVLPSEGSYLTQFYPRLRRMDEKAGIAHLVQEWITRLINPDNQPPYWTLGRTRRGHAPYLNVARNALFLADHARSIFDSHTPFQPHLALVMAVHWARCGGRTEAPATYWADKTALNEFHVRALHAAFPEAKFIHMIRDPRAIFASRKQANIGVFGTPGNPFRLSYRIAQSFRLARQNQARLGQSTYHVVRYEDLLSDLLGEIAVLRAFLGITDHESLMQPTSSGLPCVANSSFNLPFTAGRVQNHSATYYQNILTPVEHKLIACFTGRHAERRGYSLRSGGLAAAILAGARYALTRRLN